MMTRRKFRVKGRKRWEDPISLVVRINEMALG